MCGHCRLFTVVRSVSLQHHSAWHLSRRPWHRKTIAPQGSQDTLGTNCCPWLLTLSSACGSAAAGSPTCGSTCCHGLHCPLLGHSWYMSSHHSSFHSDCLRIHGLSPDYFLQLHASGVLEYGSRQRSLTPCDSPQATAKPIAVLPAGIRRPQSLMAVPESWHLMGSEPLCFRGNWGSRALDFPQSQSNGAIWS